MLSFGWKQQKRPIKKNNDVFTNESEDISDVKDDEIDWLTAAKRPKLNILEDSISKAKRLKEEGSVLASNEKWWAAIRRWDVSIKLYPDDHTTHEMMAQAYMQVGEVFPSVKSAGIAVKLCPNWWIGHQTLGRAQLGMGEVELAIKSFSRALLLNPDCSELWKQDLEWAVNLLKNHKNTTSQHKDTEIEEPLTITEVNDEMENFAVPQKSKMELKNEELYSNRYYSKVLKKVPQLSDQTRNIKEHVEIQPSYSKTDISNLVKLRVKR